MVLVGLVDSSVGPEEWDRVAAARAFLATAGGIEERDAAPDRLGHGAAVARTVLTYAPAVRLAAAQVFVDRLVTSPAAVAAGLSWLTAEGARLVTLSLGLTADRAVLREACAAAGRAGVILVASAPARGEPVFPAAYPGVISVCGDARCAPGEVSALGGTPADYGVHVRADGGDGGASFAVGHLAGLLAARLTAAPGLSEAACRTWLDSVARYRGRERRT